MQRWVVAKTVEFGLVRHIFLLPPLLLVDQTLIHYAADDGSVSKSESQHGDEQDVGSHITPARTSRTGGRCWDRGQGRKLCRLRLPWRNRPWHGQDCGHTAKVPGSAPPRGLRRIP